MRKILQVLVVIGLLVGSVGLVWAHEGHAETHPVGTNVVHEGTVYFVSPDGTLRAYTSAGAFLSYGFNSWAGVQPASASDLALPRGHFVPPQDGKIMCDNKVRVGTCYLITEGWKIGFVTEADFKNLGFSFSRALWGDVWFLGEKQNIANGFEAHRPGVLVNDGGTIYYVTAQGLAGFPTYGTFLSWGYNLADVVPANAADRQLAKTGIVYARQPGELNPYHIVQPTPTPTPNQLRVITPNDAESWALGSMQTIRWDNTSFDSRVDIYLNEYLFCDYYQPCVARPQRVYVLANQVLNTGWFSWNVGTFTAQGEILPGYYKVSVSGSTQKNIFDESDYPFQVITSKTEAQNRDATRLSDVRQMASALELYYNDYLEYPGALQNLSPGFIGVLPVAPTLVDGSCTGTQNTYTYTKQPNSSFGAGRYTLTFCLGAASGGYTAGPHTLTEAGIY